MTVTVKKPLSVYLEPEQLRALNRWAAEDGEKKVARLVRRIIDAALADRRKTKGGSS